MTEIKYQYYYWGPFLFHATLGLDKCKILLEAGSKVRGQLDTDHSPKLAGHITEQYRLDKKIVKSILSPYLGAYCSSFNQWKGDNFLVPDCTLLTTWINYMKAEEFNPPHFHNSDLSFIIFPDVPNEIIKECKSFKGTDVGPGGVCWTYGEGDALYITMCSKLPKTGDIFIFPASLKHYVYPFKSKVTRISVSGNLNLPPSFRQKQQGVSTLEEIRN